MLTFKIHEQLSTSLTAKEFLLRNAVLLKSFPFLGKEQPTFLLTFQHFSKPHRNKM